MKVFDLQVPEGTGADHPQQTHATVRLEAVPVAWLLDARDERVGVLYRWNTGDEAMAWFDRPIRNYRVARFEAKIPRTAE